MDIVRQYLRREKYDGLCDPDNQCGCLVDDLAPCCPGEIGGCRPGYKYICQGCDADGCDPGLGAANWHVGAKRPRVSRYSREPLACRACGSTATMPMMRCNVLSSSRSVSSSAWVCQGCGEAHIKKGATK
jgi:hypothetical protein